MSATSLSRAQFLRGALGLTTAAVGAGLLAPVLAHAEVAAAPAAQATGPQPMLICDLSLNGAYQGRVSSARGGNAYAELTPRSPRTLGPTSYRPIDIAINMSMGPGIYEAINNAWSNRGKSVSGSVFRAAGTGGLILERRFEGADVIATTFPTFDLRQSDEIVWLTVRLAPRKTQDQAIKSLPFAADSIRLRVLRSRDFALDIGDVNTKGVVRVDSFTFQSGKATGDEVGKLRADTSLPLTPILKVSVYRQYSSDWVDWLNTTIAERRSDAMKSGALRFLSFDGTTELGRLNLINAGICELTEPAAGSSETEDVLVATVFCERMELVLAKPEKH